MDNYDHISRISELLLKERRGTLTDEEREELDIWIDASALNREWYERMTTEEDLVSRLMLYGRPRTRENVAWSKIAHGRRRGRALVVQMLPAKMLAASMVLVALGAGMWYYFGVRHERISTGQILPVIANDVAPGGNKAILTLANGSKVLLDNAGMGLVNRRGDVRVIKVDSGEIAYQVGVHNSTDEVAEAVDNVLSTPLGGQYKLLLSDGTEVWLNAASSLHFPAVFKGNERRVELTGEAYFEVAENKKMPFSVVAGGMKVQVLGTSFNLKAYPDEKKVTATLVNGRVQVLEKDVSKMLAPGDQATLNEQGQLSLHSDADLEEALAWKNGQFIFNSDDIGTIVQQVGRWYNIPIKYPGKVPGGTFSGRIRRSAPLSHVLQMLSYEGIHAEIQQGVLVIK